MKFPKGVTRCKPPKRSNHAGRVWDVAPLTLPDGREIQAHLDLSWGENFYFEIEGVWRKAPIDIYGRHYDRTLAADLRDLDAVEATEVLVDEYEEALRTRNLPEIERLCEVIEASAAASGYNDNGRIIALHNEAERLNLEAQANG